MPSPKSTTILLKQLRELMVNLKFVGEPIQAYIVTTLDAHSSEYTADCDNFRAFITGFTGSAGTAIITHDQACLWTDGRYFLQASQEMDINWTLMKEGVPGTPTQAAWLLKTLPMGSCVGVDSKLFSLDMWNLLHSQLEPAGHKLVPVLSNLLVNIWHDRPSRPANRIIPLSLKFTGSTVREKLEKVIQQMKEKNACALVISTLDDIAWTLNLRGSDISYNPLFFSYLVVHPGKMILFVNSAQITDEVKAHLNNQLGESFYSLKPYDEIDNYLKSIARDSGTVWFPDTVNYSLASIVPKNNQHIEISPTSLMKAVKNPTEKEGMINAHIKDAAALCCYFAWLENNVSKQFITEMTGAEKLEEFRALQEDFMGASFPTISSVGPNGAIIHYRPTPETSAQITTDSLYLCDSGAQFKDGTTDVTRTMHFGKPTDYEKECYTRVLKGQLKLGNCKFPSKIKGNCLDSFAREFLWEVGLDYSHGTSHGIGHFLNVHEGPMGISWRPYPEDPGLEAGMFLSNEPGYYENGKFGIRIEDIVLIVPADLPYNFNNRDYLTFETVTLVPKQTKLVVVEMLTEKEITILNNYHKKCREIVGPLLDKQGHIDAKEWLWRETQPIKNS